MTKDLKPVCEHCQSSMPVPARAQGGGRTKRYCSTRCRVAAHRDAKRYTLHGALGTEPANQLRRRPVVYVVPCGAEKAEIPCPARDLYTSAHFRFTLAAVEAAAARDGAVVRILSARHGLVSPDAVLMPYDTTLRTKLDGQELADLVLLRQLRELNPVRVLAFTPRRYTEALAYALSDSDSCQLVDAFYGCRGIGDQRAVLAQL